MSDIIIRDRQYVLYYRNGVKRVPTRYGFCDEDAQREGYYRKIDDLMLHFNAGYSNPGHPTFEQFCHQMGINIEHETVDRILIKDVDPWICFTDTNDMVLYFGKDKPIKKTKTYEKVSKHVKFWQNSYKWGNKEKYGNEYYYWDVKDKKKLVVCSFNCDLIKAFPELIDQTNSNLVPYTVDLTKVEPFKQGEHEYEFCAEHIKQILKQQEEDARKKAEYEADLERRKNTPGYCCRCGCEGADYVANPYCEDMYGTTVMEWLCSDCYHDIAGDI